MSRDKILAALAQNQPELSALPAIPVFERDEELDLVVKFKTMAEGIGSTVYLVQSETEIQELIGTVFAGQQRIVCTVPSLVSDSVPAFVLHADPHTYEDVDVAIFKPLFAVAENSAVWLTEAEMGVRALPFITQQIVMIVEKERILPDMHAVYQRIGDVDYGYCAFIAGPSKTADIEQSLVLGAHGPRSMTIFVLDK